MIWRMHKMPSTHSYKPHWHSAEELCDMLDIWDSYGRREWCCLVWALAVLRRSGRGSLQQVAGAMMRQKDMTAPQFWGRINRAMRPALIYPASTFAALGIDVPDGFGVGQLATATAAALANDPDFHPAGELQEQVRQSIEWGYKKGWKANHGT